MADAVDAGTAGHRPGEVGALEQPGLRLGRGQHSRHAGAGERAPAAAAAAEQPAQALVSGGLGCPNGRSPRLRGAQRPHERHAARQGRDEPANGGGPGGGRLSRQAALADKPEPRAPSPAGPDTAQDPGVESSGYREPWARTRQVQSRSVSDYTLSVSNEL